MWAKEAAARAVVADQVEAVLLVTVVAESQATAGAAWAKEAAVRAVVATATDQVEAVVMERGDAVAEVRAKAKCNCLGGQRPSRN